MRPVRVAAGAGSGLAAAASTSLKTDVAAAFRAEHAAILGFYAARIEAARRGARPADIAAAVRAILNEQTVALRALADRRDAAERREREQKPERPSLIARSAEGGRGLG